MEDALPAAAQFGPDHRYTLAAGGGGLIAAAGLVLAGDPPSRLVAAVALVVLLSYVLSDLVFSPRLVATPAGLKINAPLTRTEVPWHAVESVHADSRSRLGLRSTTLEIDAGATLAVFSRRALGADPEQAAGLIRAFRPPGLATGR